MRKKTILYFGAAILFLVILYINNSYKQNELNSIFEKPSYAIGIVYEYTKKKPSLSNYIGQLQSVAFFYQVNDSIFKNKYECIEYPIKEDINKGDSYLVIYNTNEPQKSRLLTNFSIKDSSDFKRYISLIKEGKLKIE